jgi:hypothetical protein
MAYMRYLTIITIAVFSLGSCADLFKGNLFEEFDGPPDASDILGDYVDANGQVSTGDAADFIADLSDAAASARFYDDLSASDRTNLNTALSSVYDNGAVAVSTRQDASILAGEIATRGTDAGETINNVANVLVADGGGDSFNDPAALMDLIIPDSAKGDAAAIEAIIDDLITAADAYEALGATLTDTDGDGTDDGPDGANMTEIAQKAAVAIAVKNLAGDTSSTQLAGDVAAGTVDTSGSYSDPLAGATNLDNILEAGGLGGLIGV